MSRSSGVKQGAFGLPPRVDLLPQEIKDSHRSAGQRAWMSVGVVAALILMGGAIVLSMTVAADAQASLEREQERTLALLAEQAEFSEVRTVTALSELVASAQLVAVSTEIQWRPFINAVQATLPADVTIVEFSINSASPLDALPTPGSPLLVPRAATIVFTAESVDLPNVRAWLDNLSTVRGFTDATPGAVRLNEGSGLYEATITMGVDDTARSGRFAPVAETDTADSNDESGDN